MKNFFYFLVLCLAFSSCNRDDESDVVIIAKTIKHQWYYNAGEKIIFEIESFANEGYITSINITSVTSYKSAFLDANRKYFQILTWKGQTP